MISVPFVLLVTSVLILLPLFLHSVLFRSHQFCVPTVLCVSERIPTFSYSLGIRFFLIYLEHRIIFPRGLVFGPVLRLFCGLATPVNNILMIGQLFLGILWVFGQSVKLFFELIISTKFCSCDCEYTMSALIISFVLMINLNQFLK